MEGIPKKVMCKHICRHVASILHARRLYFTQKCRCMFSRWTGQSSLHFTDARPIFNSAPTLLLCGKQQLSAAQKCMVCLHCEYQTASVRRKQIQLLSDSKDVLILGSRHYSVSRLSVQTRSKRKTRKGRVEITVAVGVTEDDITKK